MKTLLFYSLLMIFLISCNSGKESNNQKTIENQEMAPGRDLEIEEGFVKYESERFIETERALAESKLKKYFSPGPEAMQILSSKKYEVDYILTVNHKRPQKIVEGEWLDFSNDFVFTWYKNDTLFQKGQYYYGMETDRLLMLSNDPADFPSEWTVKSSGDAIVLVGTATFKNNNTQIHMLGTLKE